MNSAIFFHGSEFIIDFFLLQFLYLGFYSSSSVGVSGHIVVYFSKRLSSTASVHNPKERGQEADRTEQEEDICCSAPIFSEELVEC